MKDLLEVSDRRTPRKRAEYALLLFLYNTGARVSEATHQQHYADIDMDMTLVPSTTAPNFPSRTMA